MRYLLLSIMITSLSLVSCAPQSESELYGTYVADYEFAREKLVIYEDGTYYQEVTLKSNSHVDTKTGTWEYRCEQSVGHIGFRDFLYTRVWEPHGDLNPEYARQKPGWLVVLPVTQVFHITIGSSQTIKYTKIGGVPEGQRNRIFNRE